jgi:hypothetical protein
MRALVIERLGEARVIDIELRAEEPGKVGLRAWNENPAGYGKIMISLD